MAEEKVVGKGNKTLRMLQARVFTLTWLSYFSYYLTRKHFSVAKSTLNEDFGISVGFLGGIDTLYLCLYALGQFINGGLGDRYGARKMISIGMLGTAGLSILFGVSSISSIFLIAFGLNGLFQSTGWPNNVKAMGPWFSRKQRGLVMGVWATNFQVGGLVATALATFLLAHFGWRYSFLVPAFWVAAVGIAIYFFLVEKPQDRGLPPMDDEPAPSVDENGTAGESSPFKEAIRMPALWILGGAYFGLKLIRYSLLFWLPFYLYQALGYSKETSGYLSTSFEAGGIIGVIVIGFIADRWFTKNAIRLVMPVIFGLAASFLILRISPEIGMWAVGLNLGLIGFLLFGPDTLISGAVAQNVGKNRSTASAAGIINGIGSIGAAAQGFLTAWVSQKYGWQSLFTVFLVFAFLAGITLTPLALRKKF